MVSQGVGDSVGGSASSSTSDARQAEPQRTCIGCRGKAPRSSLLRLVVGEDGTSVVPDPHKTRPGRGAWLHPDAGCLEQAFKRRAWGRAFKRQLSVRSEELQLLSGETISATSSFDDTPRESHPAISHDHDRKRV